MDVEIDGASVSVPDGSRGPARAWNLVAVLWRTRQSSLGDSVLSRNKGTTLGHGRD